MAFAENIKPKELMAARLGWTLACGTQVKVGMGRLGWRWSKGDSFGGRVYAAQQCVRTEGQLGCNVGHRAGGLSTWGELGDTTCPHQIQHLLRAP